MFCPGIFCWSFNMDYINIIEVRPMATPFNSYILGKNIFSALEVIFLKNEMHLFAYALNAFVASKSWQ